MRKSFQMKLPRNRMRERAPKRMFISPVTDQEPEMTGYVNGRKASDLEERWARTMRGSERVDGFHFRKIYFTIPNHVELDYLMFAGALVYPIQLDSTWIHSTAEARAHDMSQDARLNDLFNRWTGYQEVSRITEKWIKDPVVCKSTLNMLLAGRVFRPWEV